jgi:hypothetical protein
MSDLVDWQRIEAIVQQHTHRTGVLTILQVLTEFSELIRGYRALALEEHVIPNTLRSKDPHAYFNTQMRALDARSHVLGIDGIELQQGDYKDETIGEENES